MQRLKKKKEWDVKEKDNVEKKRRKVQGRAER